MLKLPPPSLENEDIVINEPVALKLKHYVNGAVIRYTTDGTEPDSVHSLVYDQKVPCRKCHSESESIPTGLISSDITETEFLPCGIETDSCY